MPDQPALRPAATVLLVRDAPAGCEVLMLRRNLQSDFVGGAYVFPGGKVDAADAEPAAHLLVEGLDDVAASKRLGVSDGGLAYYVACLRELFEEAGLLLATTPDGDRLRLDDESTKARLARHRRAVNQSERRFLDVVAEESLRLDLHALEYLAHWVTPEGMHRRFDTRFFVALAPDYQEAAHDAGETVADVWIRPQEALDRYARGQLEMIFPTIKNLEAIAHLTTAHEVLEYARAKTSIPRIQPRVVRVKDEERIVLPGDPLFGD